MLMVAGGSDRYLTPKEVAEQLQVHPVTVRVFLRNGILPGKKVGDLWRVSQMALDAYIAGKGGIPIGEEEKEQQNSQKQ